jgi:outer membrane protein assembly factor BamB
MLCVACTSSLLPSVLRADWLSFRNGGASRAESSLPTVWTPQSGIAWQRELPGYGQSTPVVYDGRIYLTAVEGPMKEKLQVLCLNSTDGQTVWQYELSNSKPSPSNYMNSRAAPTPAVDSEGVYAFFESGHVLAIDLDGNLRWQRDLPADYGAFENNHGLGSSPAQNATHLFLNIDHKGPSYLLALNKADGSTSWKVDRPSSSSWSSPIVANTASQEHVIVSSGGTVTAYSASTGEQQWKIEDLDGNSVPSPTLVDKQLFIGARLPEFSQEGDFRSNCCIELEPQDSQKPKISWQAEKALSDYASPVVCDGLVYLLNKIGVLHCLDAATGKICYRTRLGTQCWGTPIVSGSLIYFFGKDGKTQVVRGGRKFELLASNLLWDEASPPKPETYVEYSGNGHGHGGAGGSSGGGRPGGGMLAALMKGDRDGDGNLNPDEVPDDLREMLPRIDTNGDGGLDAGEIEAMVKSFAARRADSQASARDPIVYGAVASEGQIIIRTGTRLYCIR